MTIDPANFRHATPWILSELERDPGISDTSLALFRRVILRQNDLPSGVTKLLLRESSLRSPCDADLIKRMTPTTDTTIEKIEARLSKMCQSKKYSQGQQGVQRGIIRYLQNESLRIGIENINVEIKSATVRILQQLMQWADPNVVWFISKFADETNYYIFYAVLHTIQQIESHFEAAMSDELHQIQYAAFAEGIDWSSIKAITKTYLNMRYDKRSKFVTRCPTLVRDSVLKLIEQAPPYDVRVDTGEAIFRKRTADGTQLLPHTQVKTRSDDSHAFYELIGTPDAEECSALRRYHGIKAKPNKPFYVGKGSFSVNRLARKLGEESFVNVKKFKQRSAYKGQSVDNILNHEVNIFSSFAKHPRLIQYHGFASMPEHSPVTAADTGYLFMELASTSEGLKNGTKLIDEFHKAYPQKADKLSTEYQIKQRQLAYDFIAAAVAVHNGGYAHRDIKPDNYFVTDQGVKLGDFGLAHKNVYSDPDSRRYQSWAGTLIYGPPESVPHSANTYSVPNHDPFSLGLVLFNLKTNKDARDIKDKHLYVGYYDNNQQLQRCDYINLNFSKCDNRPKRYRCIGIYDTENIVGNTLDEVIAKLLTRDPSERISAREALALPYFAPIHEQISKAAS